MTLAPDLDTHRRLGQGRRLSARLFDRARRVETPGAAVQVMDACGHSPELEEPARFADLLLGGLR